jgi:gamma-glutamylcyclotransferase (GGCT)/AIG2-like uncharacterized protein YtfP
MKPLSKEFLLKRGYCCKLGCKNCPYEENKMNRVFVYGTLMKNHRNHHMLKGAKFLGDYETGPGYTKIVSGLPYLVEDPDGVGTKGELYEVSDLLLKMLDRFEGSPDWYVRKTIKVYAEDKDIGIDAWVYIMPKERI